MGQALAALKIDLHWLAAQLSSLIEPARSDIANRVESILRRLDEVIESVRSVASECAPRCWRIWLRPADQTASRRL